MRQGRGRRAVGRHRGEDGQLILLIVFYALIAAAMTVVAVDAAILFLAQRGLTSAADGAALAASQALDERGVYGPGPSRPDLPLAADEVDTVVADYLDRSGVTAQYPGLAAQADTDGQVVTVRLARPVHLPFLGFSAVLTDGYPGGTVPVRVTVRARAPLR